MLLKLTFIWITFASTFAADLIVKSSVPVKEFDHLFVRESGWLGGDAVYSCPITRTHNIWLFQDTWIGHVTNRKRTNATIINNTVGVQNGKGTNSTVEFYWKHISNGKSTAYFVPPDGHGWFWPKGCVYINNHLHILISQIDHSKENHGVMSFESIGVWHAIVENPLESPDKWKLKFNKTPLFYKSNDKSLSYDASIMLNSDNYLYIYGFMDKTVTFNGKSFTDREMIVSRVEPKDIANYNRWKFFHNNQWIEDFRNSTALFSGIGTEFSVHYVNSLGKYIVVTSGPFLSPKIIGRTSMHPWGEWSHPIDLYQCQEVKQKDVFCYAGKSHPELSDNHSLIISYACNSFNIGDVVNDANLYMPRFVRVVY